MRAPRCAASRPCTGVADGELPRELVAAAKQRRPDVDPAELIATSWAGLHRQLDARIAAGLTKFGDVTRAGDAAAELTTFYDCYSAAESPIPSVRAAALHAASRQANLIPDTLTAQWARTALDEAKRPLSTPLHHGPEPYLNGYEVLQGLADRIPDDLVPEILRLIDPLLPRGYGHYRRMDEQIARILIGLGHNNPIHHAAVAERIAVVFEDADDLADIIVDAAPLLSTPLNMIKPHLHALLAREPGRREAQTRNAALALVSIGDRSSDLLAVADSAVTEQLESSATDIPNPVGSAESTALLAACLPVDRRTELARHYCARILDTNDTENNRATYASACRLSAADLPAYIRNELFDQLFPLDAAADSEHPSDVMQSRLSNPFGFIRHQGRPGELRRQVAKTLAVLAGDRARQDRVWKATQQLAVSGEPANASTVGYVGYTLAKHGYLPDMPWDAIACSPESEIRRLAAALIPFTRDVDTDLVTSLACDSQLLVRSELAQSITNIRNDSADHATDHQLLDAASDILREDPSYRVRSKLGPVAAQARG